MCAKKSEKNTTESYGHIMTLASLAFPSASSLVMERDVTVMMVRRLATVSMARSSETFTARVPALRRYSGPPASSVSSAARRSFCSNAGCADAGKPLIWNRQKTPEAFSRRRGGKHFLAAH